MMNLENRNYMSLASEIDDDNERDIYTLIAVYFMFEKEYPSKATISRITGLSAYSINKAILGLKAKKIIENIYKKSR